MQDIHHAACAFAHREAASRAFRADFVPDPADPDTTIVLAAPLPPADLFGLDQLGLSGPRFLSAGFAHGTLAASPAATGAGATSAQLTDDNCDLAVRGAFARSDYGVSGAGIKVGILSDSFNVLGGMATDIAAGNLPASVRILQEGAAGSHDEGRAMADLVHRIAPGAAIDFASATGSEAAFAAGVTALQQDGCNVIVDDVAYYDEPFFQAGGAVDAAIEAAVADGVSYFTAAGNEGQNYLQQGFAPMVVALAGLPPGAEVQNFGSAAAPQPWLDLTLPQGGTCILDLQWNQPLGASADSLGLALFDQTGKLVAQAAADAVGGNPNQVLQYTNSAGVGQFRLVVYGNGGAAAPGLFKIISYGNGTIADPAAGSGAGSVIGHEMLPEVNTVGAMAWSASPAFGGDAVPKSFSSVGNGTFLFDPEGHPLAAPETTAKVNFLAPDDSITSVLAPFCGTSAAAANAAGVAALVLQADPWLTPAQLTQVLDQSAAPAHGAAGAVGAGLLDADAAVHLALGLAHSLG